MQHLNVGSVLKGVGVTTAGARGGSGLALVVKRGHGPVVGEGVKGGIP